MPNAPDDGLLHTLADIPGLVQPSGTASAITGTPEPGVLAWTTTEPRRPERAQRDALAVVRPDSGQFAWKVRGPDPLDANYRRVRRLADLGS